MTNINVGARGAHERGRFGRVTAGGPSFAEVNAHARTPVQRVSLAESGRAGSAGLRGHTLSVFAPNVDPSATARPHSVAATLNHPGVNRGTDITRPLAVNSRVSPATPTAQQVAEARTAQAHASSGVATNGTHFRLANDRSFSTMQPVGHVRVATHQSASVNSAAVHEGPSAFTGLGASSPVSHNTRVFNGESAFTGQGPSDRVARENVEHVAVLHAESTGGGVYSTGGFFHPGGPEHHDSAVAQHESFAPHHSAAPSFHDSAPAAQHFSAPHFGGGGGGAPHFGGGGGGAPHFGGGSVHAGGGGGGGGHPGGGGGGGGHPGGGGGGGHRK